MYFCYIDESGNSGSNLKDKNQPNLLLSGLLVPHQKVKIVEDKLRIISRQLFGAESANTDFEFHGDGLYNARKKDRYFRKLPLSKRLKIINELMNLIVADESLKLVCITISKKNYSEPGHIQQTAFHLLVNRLEKFLTEDNEHCLLIADEQNEVEQNLINDLDHFKQHGTSLVFEGSAVSHVIDSVHFVKSHNNYVMQLSDVACYVMRKAIDIKRRLAEQCRNSESEDIFEKCKLDNLTKGDKYFLEWQEKLGKSIISDCTIVYESPDINDLV